MIFITTNTNNSINLYVGKELIIEIKRQKDANTADVSIFYLGTDKFTGSLYNIAQVSTAKYSIDEIETIGLRLVAMASDMKNIEDLL